MLSTLQPTLWRTCRALANRARLRLLETVIRTPDQAVSHIASTVGIEEALASRYLRALNARGLIQADRRGAWVLYRAVADRSVPSAGVLLSAIKQTLARERDPVDRMFRVLTGFTHPRRVAIVRELRRGEIRQAELRRRTKMSQTAVEGHLKKLRDRGFVVSGKRGYRLRRPSGILARALLKLACE